MKDEKQLSSADMVAMLDDYNRTYKDLGIEQERLKEKLAAIKPETGVNQQLANARFAAKKAPVVLRLEEINEERRELKAKLHTMTMAVSFNQKGIEKAVALLKEMRTFVAELRPTLPTVEHDKALGLLDKVTTYLLDTNS